MDVFFENQPVFMRMASTAVDYTHACKADADRFQQELLQDEARFLKIQTVEIDVRLHRKTPRAQIVKI